MCSGVIVVVVVIDVIVVVVVAKINFRLLRKFYRLRWISFSVSKVFYLSVSD
jgi:hypothetical protein